MGPRILIYHQVGVDLGREMEVPTATFERQLDWLLATGEIVSLETALEQRAEPAARRLAVLTFDDGFADVYENAFPILQSRGMPFTLYLTTRPIESRQPLDGRYPQAGPLTWDQINIMTDSGLATLGAHTHTHPDLRQLDAESIAAELDESNELIERRTGVRPQHFTYPWGWWAEAADPLVRDRYLTSTVGGRHRRAATEDTHRVPRLPVQLSDGFAFFRRRVTGGLRAEEAVRHIRSRLR